MAWVASGAALALVALAMARLRLRRIVGKEIIAFNDAAIVGRRTVNSPAEGDRRTVERTAWLVPRVAKRVPWRSDCLVQAMAAQQILMRRGIASKIVIGADRDGEAGITPHAWLCYGDRVVTGGDISRYRVLLG